MNRIILIGNGFDLAHDLKTSYKHFIDDFWNNEIDHIRSKITTKGFEDEFVKIGNVPSVWTLGVDYAALVEATKGRGLQVKNEFLKIITEKTSLQNWVDIEDEYYRLLKEIAKEKCRIPNYDIIQLNKDLKQIELLLAKYLQDEERNNPPQNKHGIESKIFSEFYLRDFTKEAQKYLKNREFGQEEYPSEFILLSFNYTNTVKLYKEFSYYDELYKTDFIHIHGALNGHRPNPIIFGFGDELDEDFRQIENLNDNRYLENIKSIKYLETRNYRRLLEYIESDHYQVFIMGHSCGISDRTLLNTLLENEKCISIKVFYHETEDGDNFSDLVRNISRNFNNKALVREKVVPKEQSYSLL